MGVFEYGLPVAWIIEFTEAFDFRKFDVTLDIINLKSSLENNKQKVEHRQTKTLTIIKKNRKVELSRNKYHRFT